MSARFPAWLIAALIAAVPVLSPAAAPLARAAGADQPGEARYIVRLRPGADVDLAAAAATASGARVRDELAHVFPGLIVSATKAEADRLAESGQVLSVAPDRPVRAYGVQADPTWGLDRIDQVSGLDGFYSYRATAANVIAYVIDSGLYAAHEEFRGRVAYGAGMRSDYTFDPGAGWADCNGHGTHVAGTIGGTTYGVAKQVRLVPIRALDCQGAGYTSTIIQAMDWVIADHAIGSPAVLNLSLGGDLDTQLNAAVARVVADGVTVVVAAGNSSVSACSSSPASAGPAITVAATDRYDREAGFTNYGGCVDLYAPGVAIKSAATTASGATTTMSGTSMAAPHVAGAAALILALRPTWTPAQVTAKLVADATAGAIGNARSANRLLRVEPGPAVVTPAPVGFSDPPGTDHDQYEIPATAGVEYLVGEQVAGPGAHPATGTVTVTARARPGYELAGTTTWTNTFTDLLGASAAAAVFRDGCGTAEDAYTIPPSAGVQYLVDGAVTAPGTYPGRGRVTVTAQALAGYQLTAATSWAQTFSSANCKLTVPRVALVGSARVGSTLKVATPATKWRPGPVALSYQWYRDRSRIVGAVGLRYRVTRADRGHRLKVVVTGRKTGYTVASSASPATGPVR